MGGDHNRGEREGAVVVALAGGLVVRALEGPLGRGETRLGQAIRGLDAVGGQVVDDRLPETFPHLPGDLAGRDRACPQVELQGSEGTAVQPHQHERGAVLLFTRARRGADAHQRPGDLEVKDPNGSQHGSTEHLSSFCVGHVPLPLVRSASGSPSGNSSSKSVLGQGKQLRQESGND